MPNYDYKCTKCEHEFEERQRITAEAGATCPECSCAECIRLISAGSSFHLKGTGWHASDYKSSGRTGTATSKKG